MLDFNGLCSMLWIGESRDLSTWATWHRAPPDTGFGELLQAFCRWGKLTRWTASKRVQKLCVSFQELYWISGGLFQYGETKALFSQDRAALWFVKVIENENLSGSGSSSQAPVLPAAAEDGESCWGCLRVRACVFFFWTREAEKLWMGCHALL